MGFSKNPRRPQLAVQFMWGLYHISPRLVEHPMILPPPMQADGFSIRWHHHSRRGAGTTYYAFCAPYSCRPAECKLYLLYSYWDNLGIMEKGTIAYWGFIGFRVSNLGSLFGSTRNKKDGSIFRANWQPPFYGHCHPGLIKMIGSGLAAHRTRTHSSSCRQGS